MRKISGEQTFLAVEPVLPVVAYIGGKRILAKTLIPMIEAVPHKLYCEPFVGMGGVFFRSGEKTKVAGAEKLSNACQV